MTDIYQQRYLAHRKRKAAMLAGQMARPEGDAFLRHDRRSVRVFEDRNIATDFLKRIFEAARVAPSSCNRQAITLRGVPGSEVGELLAGGEGWADRAPLLVLLFADLRAYKAPGETAFMPWLDAGVIMASLVYAAHSFGVASCIINPRVRPENEQEFRRCFNPDGRLFCGAVALGYSAINPETPGRKPLAELAQW